ncbi:MAG: hypothetical protein HY594_00075 [Candidatus Omnitrophica bacterium]|nr:hypothetical protein [Candidatus Omnitrophota bacterium]
MNDPEISLTFLRERLARGKSCTVMLEGPSMQPLIPSGALLTVAPVHLPEIEAGDILLVLRKGELITHRVVKILTDGNPKKFILKGDANLRCDPGVGALDLVGKVTGVETQPLDRLQPKAAARQAAAISYWQALLYETAADSRMGRLVARALRNRPGLRGRLQQACAAPNRWWLRRRLKT